MRGHTMERSGGGRVAFRRRKLHIEGGERGVIGRFGPFFRSA